MPVDEQELYEAALGQVMTRFEAAAEQATEAVVHAYVEGGHVISWDMVKSIYYMIDTEGGYFKIVVPTFYARFLEFGTKHQPARHVLFRAVSNNLDKTIAILDGEENYAT